MKNLLLFLLPTITPIIYKVIEITITKIIFPWYATIRYKGSNLNGNWDMYFFSEKDYSKIPNANAIVKQSGNKIKGTLTVTRWADGSEANSHGYINGEIRGDKVIMHFVNKEAQHFDYASGIFKIINNTNTLEGIVIGVEPFNGNIYTVQRKVVRKTE